MRIKNKKPLISSMLLFIFAAIAVFGLSPISNTFNSNVNTSKASAQEPADINSDNKVDIFDLSILLANWNKTGVSASDINADSVVNIFDLSLLLSKWGTVQTASRYEATIQAEDFTQNSGTQTENTSDIGGGQDIGYITNGDYTVYGPVNFTSSVNTVSARFASASAVNGSIEVRRDSASGTLLATIPISSTGGWQVWSTASQALSTSISGNATIVLVFRSATTGVDFMNLNWIQFDNGVVEPPVANAGLDATGYTTQTAYLDGSGSTDPASRTLSYTWAQTSGPAVTLQNASTKTAYFVPTQTGTYTFSLTVNNGQLNSNPDSVSITISDIASKPAMPTLANTGPRYSLTDMTTAQFYSTRTCNRQRITGDVAINQQTMRAQTFNITDCEITGNLSFYLINNDQQLPADQMPIINIAYTDIMGGINSQHAVKLNVDHSYVYQRVQMKLTDGWPITQPGYAPYTFTNSLLYNPYQTQPTHTETLQTAGRGTDTSFTNVTFMQQGGPVANTGVTAAINYEGSGTVFEGCYFVWDGETPAVYAAYISGINVVVRNSFFDAGTGGYLYPNTPSIMPSFINNRNYRTNQPITP